MTPTASQDRPDTPRIFGLDIIRTLSFFTIASHHFTLALFEVPAVFSPFYNSSTVWKWIEVEARLLSFSGQTILFLTSVLISYTAKNHEKALRLIPIMLALWVLSCYFDATPDSYFFAWDIFPLIALGLAGCYLITRVFPTRPWVLPLSGLILLSIPFWQFPSLQALDLYPRHILIGDCEEELSDWPVLPWVGLVFFGYGIGSMVKPHSTRLARFIKGEHYFWIPLLLWTPLFWGTYYHMRIGTDFSCDSMRREPIAFLAHLFGILFVVRLCFLSAVNDYLKQNRFAQFLSRLEINVNFGIAYFYHFLLISALIHILNPSLARSPELSATITFLLLPLTELSLRFFRLVMSAIRSFFNYCCLIHF